jgi:hypothetical protein
MMDRGEFNRNPMPPAPVAEQSWRRPGDTALIIGLHLNVLIIWAAVAAHK